MTINGVSIAKHNGNNGPVYAAAAVVCVLIVTLGLVFSGVLGGGPITIPGGALSTVSVSASGTATGIPSRAEVSLYINATGNTTSAATANLSAKLIAFNRTVYSYVNGNMSLVKTGYYNVGKPYQYYPYNRTNSTVPYEAQEYVTVTLPQISKLNSFLSAITNVTGLQVQGVSTLLSDSQVAGLRQQALQSALTNATGQATSIIGSNAKIVNTTISVGSYYAIPYPIYASAGSGGIAVPQRLYYNGTASVYESITAIFYYRK